MNSNIFDAQFYSTTWDGLKDKLKHRLTMETYANLAERGIMSRLSFDGLPSIYIEEYLKRGVLRLGTMALYRNNEGEIVAGTVAFIGGDMYPDGVLSTAECTDGRGRITTFTDWRNNDGLAVWFANATHEPDYLIHKTADELTEIDKSIKCLVDYARAHGFIMADDEEQAKAFKRGMQDVREGKIQTLVKGSAFTRQLGDYFLKIGDVGASKWLADLDIHYHTIASRLYFLEGCELGTTIKKAQQTEDEVNRGYNASRILCEEALRYAQLFAEECAKLGLAVTVDFSDCWKIQELSDERGLLEDGEGNEPDEVADEQDETKEDEVKNDD